MKSKIYMYLFYFAMLFVIFLFMNQKSVYKSQERNINGLNAKNMRLEDSLAVAEESIAELNYFTLQGNENAMSYIDRLGLDPQSVEQELSDRIYDLNLEVAGNPLVPFEGKQGNLRINKVRFLNHRWIQADFSDGATWGEVLIEYFYDENNQWQLRTISSVLYPDN